MEKLPLFKTNFLGSPKVLLCDKIRTSFEKQQKNSSPLNI